MKHRMKGLYYCQYLVGIGHLVRSLNICRSLIKKFDIDFLLGGQDVGLTLKSPHFHRLEIPPIYLESPFEETNQEIISQEKLQERHDYIEKFAGTYDFFITEIFPFSKWRFKEEIQSLLLKVKGSNPNCLIACSLRDSFPPHSAELEEQIVEIIDRHYDVIFVHSDPRIYQLEESFSLVEKIKNKLIYTGFIVRPIKKELSSERQKRIVVSIGSGSFGGELLEAVLKVVKFFPNYQFIFVTGKKASYALINQFKSLISPLDKNIKIVPFIDHFPKYLSKSALSISLGGYTLIDIAYTKTRALVYPSTYYDQYVRALKFSAFGFLKILTQNDLTAANLAQKIHLALKMPPAPFDVDISGSETMSRELERLLMQKNLSNDFKAH